MEARLRTFYDQYDQSKLGNVGAIAAKYAGRERELFQFLSKKYNLETQFPASDPAFDFVSPAFNATRALSNPTLLPPVVGPAALRPLDNLAKCRALLPPSHPDHARTRTQPAPSPGSRDRSIGGGGAKAKARAPSLFERAATEYEAKAGPLALLATFMRSHAKVRVLIRRRTAVRGWCSGYLKAFDKHMNLFLTDVCEEFRRRACPDSDTEDDDDDDDAAGDGVPHNATGQQLRSGGDAGRSGDRVSRASTSRQDDNDGNDNDDDAVLQWSDGDDDSSNDEPPALLGSATAATATTAAGTGSAAAPGPARLRPQRYETVRRYMHQLLVRGDNVIAIHQEVDLSAGRHGHSQQENAAAAVAKEKAAGAATAARTPVAAAPATGRSSASRP